MQHCCTEFGSVKVLHQSGWINLFLQIQGGWWAYEMDWLCYERCLGRGVDLRTILQVALDIPSYPHFLLVVSQITVECAGNETSWVREELLWYSLGFTPPSCGSEISFQALPSDHAAPGLYNPEQAASCVSSAAVQVGHALLRLYSLWAALFGLRWSAHNES